MKHILLKSTLMALGIAIIAYKNAYAAYIDPNTGGMVFQVLAVLFGVISGVILVFSSRIKAAFFRVQRTFRNEDQGKNEVDEG
jgi:hypothetical protein